MMTTTFSSRQTNDPILLREGVPPFPPGTISIPLLYRGVRGCMPQCQGLQITTSWFHEDDEPIRWRGVVAELLHMFRDPHHLTGPFSS